MNNGQLDDLDSDSTKHVDWDKVYAIVTQVMIDIIDAYITCGIEFDFDEFQCVIKLSQDGILMDSTCLFALLIPLFIGLNLKFQCPQNNEIIKD